MYQLNDITAWVLEVDRDEAFDTSGFQKYNFKAKFDNKILCLHKIKFIF